VAKGAKLFPERSKDLKRTVFPRNRAHALMMRRNDADFRLLVNRELARLSRSGEIRAIHERWFGVLGKPAAILESLYCLNGLPE